MSNTKVICGFSGTLKTTIATEYLDPEAIFVGSPTKYMYDFNDRVGGQCMHITPMHGVMTRLHTLSYLKGQRVILERSLYDFAFFSIKMKVEQFDRLIKFNFKEMEGREWQLVGDRDYYLIDNQSEYLIKEVILKDQGIRSHVYKTCDDYYLGQSEYLNFIEEMLGSEIKATLTLTDELVKRIFNHEEIVLPWKFR